MTSMTLESCTQSISKRVGDDSGLNATLKIDFGELGVILIDGKSVPNVVSNIDDQADCTVTVTLVDFEALVTGDLAPMDGFMSGKLAVAGDMGIAMKLQGLL